MSLTGTLDVAAGDGGVELLFTVTNAGSNPVDLSFRSGKMADFAVIADGEERWRWSEDRMFAQALQSATLAPGEETTFEATWGGAEPGAYAAVATLEDENNAVEARREFAVD